MSCGQVISINIPRPRNTVEEQKLWGGEGCDMAISEHDISCCTHKRIAAMQDLHKLKPVKVTAWLAGSPEAPSLAKELLTVDYQEEESLSLGTWPLIGYSCPSPHIHAHMGSINYIQGVITNNNKRRALGWT